MRRKLICCLLSSMFLFGSVPESTFSEESAAYNEIVTVTTGDVYRRAQFIDSELEIEESGTTLYLTREFETTEKNNIRRFFWDIAHMMNYAGIEETYDTIAATFFCGDVVEMVSIQNFHGLHDFTSSYIGPLSSDENIKTLFPSYYYSVLGAHDRATISSKNMYDLGKQYGLDTEEPKVYPNGYLWIFSCFDSTCGFSISDNKITIEPTAKNSIESGKAAKSTVKDSLASYDKFVSENPELMPYTEIYIQYYDADNLSTKLWLMNMVKKSGKWETVTNSCPESDFLIGLNGG